MADKPTQVQPPVTVEEYALKLSPSWLLNPYTKAFVQAMGAIKDYFLTRTRSGVYARMPTYAPDDALGELGDERSIGSYPGEDPDVYRERLRKAVPTWKNAGLPYGMLLALKDGGIPNAAIVQSRERVFLLDANSNLQVMVTPTYIPATRARDFWSAFMVVIYAPLPLGWPPIPADGSNEANRITSIIYKWKPAHATLDAIVVMPIPELWDFPAGTWDEPGGHWLTDAEAAGIIYWTP